MVGNLCVEFWLNMKVMTYQQAVEEFLAQRRIAVAGVSGSKKDAANAIYNKLKAVRFCRENEIQVVPGGCPMMFIPPVDPAHKCLRWWLRRSGGIPERV